jgi:phage FluMu protein Com
MRGRHVWLPKWDDIEESIWDRRFAGGTSNISKSELESNCPTCFELNRQHVSGKDRVYVRYSELQESVTSSCQFCSLIYKTLQHYLPYSERKCFTPDEVFELRMDTEQPILLDKKMMHPYFPSIMLYTPSGMLDILFTGFLGLFSGLTIDNI